MANLQERVALITGGGSGIGSAIAERLAAGGAKVVITGRRAEPLRRIVERLESRQSDAISVCGDLADPAQARGMVDAAIDRFGNLDILINNAATYVPRPLEDILLDEWDAHFAVNVRGPLLLCQEAWPHLRRSAGVVVNVLSNLARRPVAGVAAYAASKAALLSLTQTLALEGAPHGIRVVAVAPGVVETPLHSAEHLATMAPLHPLGRVGRADEIAAAVAFLVGDESVWTTGAILDVGGGIHLV